MSSESTTPNHSSMMKDLLAAVQKQEDVLTELYRDLEHFRKKYKSSLQYDNGDGDYVEEVREQTIDLRDHVDYLTGMISAETARNYIGYTTTMDNFHKALEKTREEAEKIWKDVNVVRDVDDGGKIVVRSSLRMPKWEADILEKHTQLATQ